MTFQPRRGIYLRPSLRNNEHPRLLRSFCLASVTNRPPRGQVLPVGQPRARVSTVPCRTSTGRRGRTDWNARAPEGVARNTGPTSNLPVRPAERTGRAEDRRLHVVAHDRPARSAARGGWGSVRDAATAESSRFCDIAGSARSTSRREPGARCVRLAEVSARVPRPDRRVRRRRGPPRALQEEHARALQTSGCRRLPGPGRSHHHIDH